MGSYSAFKTDLNAERNGVQVPLGEAGTFLIARQGGSNDNFKTKFSAITKGYRREIQTETITEATARDLMMRAFAESIVLGWEGVTDENNQPLPFSRENALKLFRDLPDLFDEIKLAANNVALFRAASVEADAKNS